ncbi:MAG TPA: hypothetical protein VFR67_10075 [Pilimelia sp.]|nr:hypothetical protein [Pilimelia sp.]
MLPAIDIWFVAGSADGTVLVVENPEMLASLIRLRQTRPCRSPIVRNRSSACRAWSKGVSQLGMGIVEATQPTVGAGEDAVRSGLDERIAETVGGSDCGASGGGPVLPVPPSVEKVVEGPDQLPRVCQTRWLRRGPRPRATRLFRLPPHGRSTSLAEASARRPDHRPSSAGRTARPAAFAGVHDVAVTRR